MTDTDNIIPSAPPDKPDHEDRPGLLQRLQARGTKLPPMDLAQVERLIADATPRLEAKRKPIIPDAVDPTTPLRLEVAASIAFPDGSMSASALRREAAAGHLTIYAIAGKHFTTLNDIEEMKTTCRVQAKVQGSTSKKRRTGNGSGSSATANAVSAQAALKATAQALKENLPSTSPGSTTPKQAGAAVIPIRSK